MTPSIHLARLPETVVLPAVRGSVGCDAAFEGEVVDLAPLALNGEIEREHGPLPPPGLVVGSRVHCGILRNLCLNGSHA